MTQTLVIGGGGFLGQYIVEQLVARGEQVRIFGRNHYPELESLPVEQFQGDIRVSADVYRACEGMETVFHTAALAGLRCQWEPFFEINTLGTLHVINACLKNGIRKLIYTSSPSVTFDGRDQIGVDESAPFPKHWLAHYPHSKALAEKIVLNANGHNGLLTCALRPHLIWGPRDRHLIPRLLERARLGKLRRVGNGTNRIDMIYVENAATAHLQAADALKEGGPVAGNAYFLSQGEPVNCWDWINEILALVDLPPVQRSVSLNAAWLIGSVLEKFYTLFRKTGEPLMTRFLVAQLARSHWFDISRAKNDFGYVPKISTSEGMHRLREFLQLPSNSLNPPKNP